MLIHPDVIWKKLSRPLYHVHFTVIHNNSRHKWNAYYWWLVKTVQLRFAEYTFETTPIILWYLQTKSDFKVTNWLKSIMIFQYEAKIVLAMKLHWSTPGYTVWCLIRLRIQTAHNLAEEDYPVWCSFCNCFYIWTGKIYHNTVCTDSKKSYSALRAVNTLIFDSRRKRQKKPGLLLMNGKNDSNL